MAPSGKRQIDQTEVEAEMKFREINSSGFKDLWIALAQGSSLESALMQKSEASQDFELIMLREAVEIIPERYNLLELKSELKEEFFEEIIDREIISDDAGSQQIIKFSKSSLETDHQSYFSSLCRLCANRENNMVYLLDKDKSITNFLEKIEHCLSIVVKESDDLPKHVCLRCLEKLERFNDFRRGVEEAEKQLFILRDKILSEFEKTEEYEENEIFADIDDTIIPEEFQNEYSTGKNSTNSGSDSGLFNGEKRCVYNPEKNEKESGNEKDDKKEISEKKIFRRAATHVCEECGKKFVTKERLEFHQIYHNSNEDSSYCVKCDKRLSSESSLYQHILNVHKQYKEFCCDLCGIQFRARAQLSAHQRKHKNERPFECETCEKRFYSKDILRRHKKMHLLEKPYECDKCGKRFDRNNSLKKHSLKHEIEADQSVICKVCQICKEAFTDDSIARIHQNDCHSITETSNIILELYLKEIYRCEYCDKSYSQIEYLKNHKSIHKEPLPYLCHVCDTTYGTYNQVTAHKTAHKKLLSMKNRETITIRKYFICEFCSKKFFHFTNMNIHKRTCSGSKIWSCRHCGIVFENLKELSHHKKGECNKLFGAESPLEVHSETHSGSMSKKKSYPCSYCGKIFNQKSRLIIHLRTHTGEKPYSCDLCDKSYRIKTERDNHRLTHSGEKSFKCKICEKSFANSARLREHVRSHSEKRPYACSLCDQSFKKANARNVHMMIHTGEKPFQCDICSTNFRRNGDMQKHRKTQHENKLLGDNN